MFSVSRNIGQGFISLYGGRRKGEEGLDELRETKHVHWDFEGGKKSWWYPYGK